MLAILLAWMRGFAGITKAEAPIRRLRFHGDRRIEMMHGKDEMNLKVSCFGAFARIDKDYSEYEEREASQAPSFDIGRKIFCRVSGFSHVFYAIRTGSDHKVTLARAGYPISKTDVWDFEEGKKVMAALGKIEVL